MNLHILMIPSWYRSPQFPLNGIFFREQAHVLRDAGYRMGVVAPGQYSVLVARTLARSRYRTAVEDDAGIPTYSSYTCAFFPLVPYANTWGWLRSGHRLVERYIADHGRPDLIHAQAAFQAGILAERIKRRWGVPYVLSEHSSMYLEGCVAFWKAPLVRRALAGAAVRTAVSPRLGEALERRFGPAAAGCAWIPNMVDQRFFDAPLRSPRPAGGEFRFLHVSHFDPIKDQPHLLRAFAQRFRGDATVTLRIGGDGASRAALERLAADLGIAGQVRFLGLLPHDKVVDEMRSADAFVLCSRFETFSVVLAESLACGTPVLSTACGGPECIVDASSGILVPPGDIAALADGMVRMRERAGAFDPRALRAGCARRFSRDAVLAQWRRVYDEAACAAPAGKGAR